MTIEEKMISMVDFDVFKESVKVTMGHNSKKIKDEFVMQYLTEWASAKSWLFELFGERLCIEKTIDMVADKQIIGEAVKALACQYPQYAANVIGISTSEFSQNKIEKENTPLHDIFPKFVKKGAKVTKVLSQIVNDVQFDIDLSKVLQNRTVKGVVSLSIHPMDYVTMSTNTHKWGSCMDIVDSFNKTGGFSLMRDHGTIIGFHATKTNATYSNNGGSFSWNNKISRQLYVVSEDDKQISLGHYNGTVADEVRSELSNMAKKILVQDGCDWSGCATGYAEQVGRFYYDTYLNSAFSIDGKTHKTKLGVEDTICVCCGKRLKELVSYGPWLECEGGHK